jgi:hypothetical protein
MEIDVWLTPFSAITVAVMVWRLELGCITEAAHHLPVFLRSKNEAKVRRETGKE